MPFRSFVCRLGTKWRHVYRFARRQFNELHFLFASIRVDVLHPEFIRTRFFFFFCKRSGIIICESITFFSRIQLLRDLRDILTRNCSETDNQIWLVVNNFMCCSSYCLLVMFMRAAIVISERDLYFYFDFSS